MRTGQVRLVVALALGLCAWWVSADAQQPTRIPRVGILSDESSSLAAKTFEPFAQGLRDLGYIEGQNIAFEYRYAEGKSDVLPSLAAELVSRTSFSPSAQGPRGRPKAQPRRPQSSLLEWEIRSARALSLRSRAQAEISPG